MSHQNIFRKKIIWLRPAAINNYRFLSLLNFWIETGPPPIILDFQQPVSLQLAMGVALYSAWPYPAWYWSWVYPDLRCGAKVYHTRFWIVNISDGVTMKTNNLFWKHSDGKLYVVYANDYWDEKFSLYVVKLSWTKRNNINLDLINQLTNSYKKNWSVDEKCFAIVLYFVIIEIFCFTKWNQDWMLHFVSTK